MTDLSCWVIWCFREGVQAVIVRTAIANNPDFTKRFFENEIFMRRPCEKCRKERNSTTLLRIHPRVVIALGYSQVRLVFAVSLLRPGGGVPGRRRWSCASRRRFLPACRWPQSRRSCQRPRAEVDQIISGRAKHLGRRQ